MSRTPRSGSEETEHVDRRGSQPGKPDHPAEPGYQCHFTNGDAVDVVPYGLAILVTTPARTAFVIDRTEHDDETEQSDRERRAGNAGDDGYRDDDGRRRSHRGRDCRRLWSGREHAEHLATEFGSVDGFPAGSATATGWVPTVRRAEQVVLCHSGRRDAVGHSLAACQQTRDAGWRAQRGQSRFQWRRYRSDRETTTVGWVDRAQPGTKGRAGGQKGGEKRGEKDSQGEWRA